MTIQEKIDLYKTKINKKIIETDFEDKKRKKIQYIKMTKVQYLRCLLKLLKEIE